MVFETKLIYTEKSFGMLYVFFLCCLSLIGFHILESEELLYKPIYGSYLVIKHFGKQVFDDSLFTNRWKSFFESVPQVGWPKTSTFDGFVKL
jgi:hypothetical protein